MLSMQEAIGELREKVKVNAKKEAKLIDNNAKLQSVIDELMQELSKNQQSYDTLQSSMEHMKDAMSLEKVDLIDRFDKERDECLREQSDKF